MYDSFDMACHDDDPDLRLNIKGGIVGYTSKDFDLKIVNSENLLPIPLKYNLGSLRLPADPSWPKIPQRKLADDVGDFIKPPCIVTLNGTPRRSRTIVRTPQSQSYDGNENKSSASITASHNNCNSFQNKTQIQLSQQVRSRRSGCADPRFKKVTTAVRNQMTSTDPGDDDCCSLISSKELRKSIEEEKKIAVNDWKESTRAQVVLQQEAERPDETKGKESIGVQTVQIESFELNEDVKKSEKNNNPLVKSNEQNFVSNNEFGRGNSSPVKSAFPTQFKADTPRLEDSMPRKDKTKQNLVEAIVSSKNDHSILETNYNRSKDPSGSVKTPRGIPQGSQGKQENFSSMAEKKVQATNTPIASDDLDSVAPRQENQQSSSTQSCGNRIPLLSYQNVPVQISTEKKSKSPRLFIDSAISNMKSGNLIDDIVDIPKLELPDDAVPQFSNFIDHPNARENKTKLTDQRMKQEKSADRSAVTESLKKIDDSKLQQKMLFQNDKRHDHHRTSAAINDQLNLPPNLLTDENRRLQLKSGRKNLPKLDDKEEKYCQHKNIFNISGDTFIPNHDFHIYYNEGKSFNSQAGLNVSKKFCNVIPSPRYETATTDSEAEKPSFSIDEENCGSDNHRDELIRDKTNSRFYNGQQTTDSESHTSDVANEESTRHEELFVKPNVEKREKNCSQDFFADSQKSRKSQSANQRTVYFAQHHNKTKTKTNYEQCRASSTMRQKRKHLMLNKKRVQSSEPQISSANRKLSRTPCLKKANSYLSNCTQEQQQFTADSERSYVAKNHNCRPSSACGLNVISIGSRDKNSKSTAQVNKIRFISCKEASGNRMRSGSIPHPTDLAEVKREHCLKPYERPSRSKNAKITSSLDLKKKQKNLTSAKSPRAETDIPTTEQPTTIPIKTQELLNKSYWDYYNKLKSDKMDSGESPEQQYVCQVAMGAPRLKKRRTPEEIVEESIDCDTSSQTAEQMELSLPEIRTLEQCSVLSTMINKTLDSALGKSTETIQMKQIYLNGNMRSSSDPTAGTQSAILKKLFSRETENSIISSNPVHKHKCNKRDKKIDSKIFKLKSIAEHPVVFFGCMAYALIVFLPMIYDYFFYEERDEYEDLSYVEIFFDYVIVSFKDMVGEFFDVMNKIFFKPDARMQRLSSGRWREKISKHHLI